nr:unnamed protein product [Callosobruchus chinensis]
MKSEAFIPLGVVFCLMFICDGEACSCMRQHPQTLFCRSDFVVLARVKRERVFNDTRMFKVRVRREYKVSEKGIIALKSGRVLTPESDGFCGVKMEIGKLYIISGRIESLKARINQCASWIQKWELTSRRQRKGLKLLYRNGCSCDVKYCSKKKCPRQLDSCVANWASRCEEREGICLRQPKGCMWMKTRALAQCRRRYFYKEGGLETLT